MSQNVCATIMPFGLVTLIFYWPKKIVRAGLRLALISSTASPLFSIFSLATILVGSRDHRTQFWKGAIQGPFHQSLVAIGPVVSEEKIKMWNVDGRTTDDGRQTTDEKARWARKAWLIPCHLASVLETCSRCKYYWNTAYSTLSYDRIQNHYKLEYDL